MTEGAAMTSPQTELESELAWIHRRLRQIRAEQLAHRPPPKTARERAAKRWNMD